jgi:glycosyltransferase involved in cell wall biosynthesis
MRVLHVAPQYIPAWRYGGPIRSVHGLCKGLVDLGHEVHVYTTNVDGPNNSDVPLEQAVEIDGVQVWYYPVPRFRRLFYAPKMKPVLRERVRDFDIVHIQSIWLWPMWAAARIAHAAGVPYVMTPRGMLERRLIRGRSRLAKRLWLSLVEKKSFRYAAGVHVTSRHELEEFAHFDFGAPAPFLVPNGLDPPPPAERPVDLATTPRVVFLGRVAWEKGLDRIVPAMRHIPNAHLSIHGPDWWNYGETVIRLAREAGVADRVEMHGSTEDEDKWDVLRSATIVVLPSYSENFGVAALEAMAV